MSNYSYPMLPLDDVVAFFTDAFSELGVKDTDFKQPQKDRWQRIYTEILFEIVGTNPDNINQVHFDSSGSLEYPQIHEEAVPLFNLAKAMQRFMFNIGIEDFKVNDIIQPTKGRLLRICSSLINFVRFYDERLKVYDRIREENAQEIDQRQIFIQDIENMKRKIKKIKSDREEQLPEIDQIRHEIGSFESKMEELHKVSTNKQKNAADLKSDISKNKAEIAKLNVHLNEASDEGNKLSNQIVQSPARMKGDMERQSNNVNLLKISREDKLAHLIELRGKVESLGSRESDADQALRLITAISEKVEAEKQVSAQIPKLHEQGGIKRNQIRDMEAKEDQQKRLLRTKQEKLEKVNMQQGQKKAELESMLEQLVMEKEKITDSKNDEEIEKMKVEEDIKAWQQSDKAEAHEQAAFFQAHRSKYSDLLQQLDSYHVVLGESWTRFVEKVYLEEQ